MPWWPSRKRPRPPASCCPARGPAATTATSRKGRSARNCGGRPAPLCGLPPATLSTFSTPDGMRALRVTTLACLATTLACSGGRDRGGAPRSHGSLLTYYETYDPRSLDPALSTDVPTGEMVALAYDGLTQFDPDGRLLPALADRWTVARRSPSGLRNVFHLRAAVKFHDGTRLTPAAVRQSFLRVLAPRTRGGRAR